MLDLTKHPSLKYFLFGSLYFAEGLIFALSTVIIVLFFTEKNISIEITTLVGGIAFAPWMLKFLFGPTIDFFGRYGRKIFCIIGGIIGAISLIIVAFVDPETAIIPFTALLFIGHSGVVLLDVSADAWAIQTTKVTERGKVNAAMYIGLFGGSAIGGILLSCIATFYGFEMVFITTGFLILISLILTLFVKEHKLDIKRRLIKKLLFKEFKKKNTLIVLLFCVLVAMNFGMLMFVIPDYMRNVLLLDKMQTGLLASVHPISLVIGATIGGSLSDKVGRKKILYVSLLGLLISSAFLATCDTWEKLGIIYAIIGFCTGASLYSTIGALLMDVTNPKIGGTQYSFLASISNLGELGIGMVSGSLLLYFGHFRFFLYTAVIIGASLLTLYFVKETIDKNSS